MNVLSDYVRSCAWPWNNSSTFKFIVVTGHNVLASGTINENLKEISIM